MNIPREYYSLVLNALAYIEAHLAEVCLGDAAEGVNCSLFHFSRIFNRVVHHSPYDYIMRRRLTEGGRRLIDSGRSIIDTALEVGFNNPETFSRAFKKMFKVQPKEFRRAGSFPYCVIMEPLTEKELVFRNEHMTAEPESTEEEFRFRGVMGRVDRSGFLPFQTEAARLAGRNSHSFSWHYIVPPGSFDELLYMPAFLDVDEELPCLVDKSIGRRTYLKLSYSGSLSDFIYPLRYIFRTWSVGKEVDLSTEFIILHGDETDGDKVLYIPEKLFR